MQLPRTWMIFGLILVGALLAGCTAGGAEIPLEPTITQPGQRAETETDLSTETASSATETSTPGKTPTPPPGDDLSDNSQEVDQAQAATQVPPTPTADERLKPEEWRDWPVIPTMSPGMIEVYKKGIEMGNRPDAFSKVGDCQNIPEVFLGLFDKENYVLPERIAYLQDTLDHFSGSFGREGMALKGGFVFPTVFSPLRADPSVCNPGETPYECELRVHKPSFVLISMEFRYDGRTAEKHEKYLRQAVEYALERGIVPILATKADNYEGDHSLNLTTARIAYEYQVPLWNAWLAVQPLPDHGIDWERDSYGFHITPDAWQVRSETFLQALDALWNEVKELVSAEADS